MALLPPDRRLAPSLWLRAPFVCQTGKRSFHGPATARVGCRFGWQCPAGRKNARPRSRLQPVRMALQDNHYDCGVFELDATRALAARVAEANGPGTQPLRLDTLVADRQALEHCLGAISTRVNKSCRDSSLTPRSAHKRGGAKSGVTILTAIFRQPVADSAPGGIDGRGPAIGWFRLILKIDGSLSHASQST
ncbi:hypothetical protein DPM33_33380 [Mesorhizobium hawassense]|uniref:Uncharacterized protein n=1 Tax=Mesorhizobium hawassense TaxID=1209954 RepID=A0A330H9J7_9HYPH|nr:hypothetical protein DPM33_33380 [Mesorhizobium hawassense]